MLFYFKLGFAEELALLELNSVSGQSATQAGDHLYSVDLPDARRANYLGNRLGGTIEITDEAKNVVWKHAAKSWFKRDRLKPVASGRKGMLPPKIARILLNLALGEVDPRNKTLLDPFCGTGTILIEGGVIGLDLVGNDLDRDQIHATKKNLDFFGYQAEIYGVDATKMSSVIKQPVDYIVTEPFMGKPSPNEDKMGDIAKGLTKLYLGCLKDWLKILSSGGRIAMVMPVFTNGRETFHTSKIIDDSHLLDYNIHTRGLIYSKPEATVKREIIVLEKK